MRILFNALSFIIKKINYFFEIFALVASFIMSASVILGIITRYIMLTPLAWTEEISRYFMIIMGFFGMALILDERSNIRIDFLSNKFPIVVKKILEIIFDILSIVFLSTIMYQSYLFTIEAKNHTMVILGISMSYFYMFLPLCSLVMLIKVIKMLLGDFLNFKERNNK
jgi:TRAP-type C4-dicarboxylate transport system permease small subunit